MLDCLHCVLKEAWALDKQSQGTLCGPSCTQLHFCTQLYSKLKVKLLNYMNDSEPGHQQGGTRIKPLGCAPILHLVAQPIVVPNSPHPYKPLAFALPAANPPSNLFTTTTCHAGPSQMSQPLARLHQMTVVCPSDPNRIPLLHWRI